MVHWGWLIVAASAGFALSLVILLIVGINSANRNKDDKY